MAVENALPLSERNPSGTRRGHGIRDDVVRRLSTREAVHGHAQDRLYVGGHRTGRRGEPPGEGDQRRVLERADNRISRWHDARRAEQRGVGAHVRGTLTAGVCPRHGGRPLKRRGRPRARGSRGACAELRRTKRESIPYPPPSRQHSKPTVSLGLMRAPWPPPARDTYAPISGYTRLSRA